MIARICWTAWISALSFCGTSIAIPAATEQRFTIFQHREDLPQSSVFAVTQTRDGYLWLGTGHGLARFDGLRFKTFDESNTPLLGSARAVKLFEDSRTNLWIATDTAGVFVADASGILKRQKLGDPAREGPAVTICEGQAGSVWLRMSLGQIYRVSAGRVALLCQRPGGNRGTELFLDYSLSHPMV